MPRTRFERYAPWPHGGNMASEATRSLDPRDRPLVKAIYRRFCAVSTPEAAAAQARLNALLAARANPAFQVSFREPPFEREPYSRSAYYGE